MTRQSGHKVDLGFRQLPSRLGISTWSLIKIMLASVAFAGFEVIGLSFMMPIVAYMQSKTVGGSVLQTKVFAFIESLGLPITLSSLLALAFVPVILRQGAQYVRESQLAGAQHRTAQMLRTKLVEAYLDADLRFVVENKQGELSNSLTVDALQCGMLAKSYGGAVGTALVLLIYVAGLIVLSWQLSLTAIPLVVGMGMLFRRFFSVGRLYGRVQSEASGEFSFQVSQGLSAMRLIKMSGGEADAKSRFETIIQAIHDIGWRIDKNTFRLEAMSQPLLLLGVFGLLIFAVDGLDVGLGELGAFMGVVLRCLPQLISLNSQRLNVISSIAHLERVENTIVSAQANRTINNGYVIFERFNQSLRFDQVVFAYPGTPEVDVLRGLSFEIVRGQTIALVGRSGAGKSTTIDLIPRLYDPTGGHIVLDGIALDQYDLVSLRRRIAFVTQEPMLLHDTIRNNLTFGQLEPKTDEEIWACLDLAHAKSFVEEIGLATVVGERGHRLSGGQRQRLTLARALLQNPEILILDEPTAALDTISEEAIKTALDGLRHRLTIIVVAHRLSTIQSSDKIVMLEDGRVAGEGAHAALLASCPSYGALYAGQMSE